MYIDIDRFGRAFILFFIVLSSNYIKPLLSCSLRKFLKNRLVVHVLAYFILLLSVLYFDSFTTAKDTLFYSIILYIWFWASTKLKLEYNITVLILILLMFSLAEMKKKFYSKSNEKKTADCLDLYSKYIFWTATLILIIGFVSYLFDKKHKYGHGFNWNNFIFGKNNAKC